MRGCRWLSIRTIGLASYLAAGCLHTAPPREAPMPRPLVSASPVAQATHWSSPRGTTDVPADPVAPGSDEEEKQPNSPSDYLVSQSPTVKLDVQPASAVENVPEKTTKKRAEKTAEKPAKKTVEKSSEPVEMRIQSSEPSPKPPDDPPEQPKDKPSPSLSRPDAPAVQVLRALLDHHPEEEIHEHLKSCDPVTRESMLVLLNSVARLQQDGGVERLSPHDLAVWTDRLSSLIASLQGRAQLNLEQMCFCSHIENFGDYTPLPPESIVFQPGESAHIYVQVRNISFRPLQDKFATRLKARVEIYDENSQDKKPTITWKSRLREDVRTSPCQDYYISFRYQVPQTCPAGLYTMRIFIEDWTDAAPDAEEVPKSRVAQRTLDFRVGGPVRNRSADAAPPP